VGWWDIWIPTDVSVESVASLFRLEEVTLRFSEMLIPFKLHHVTAQQTAKSEVVENYRTNVTITNRYCDSFLTVLYSHD